MRKDFEVVMLEIEDIFRMYIPYYIYLMNEEKGDILLGTANILFAGTGDPIQADDGSYIWVSVTGDDAYTDDAYFMWTLTDVPPYRVSFLQTMPIDPEINSVEQGFSVNLRYKITIVCFVMASGDNNEIIRRERYCRIIRDIVKDRIAPNYRSITLEDVSTALMSDPNGVNYESCAVTFSLDITE